MMGRKLDLTGLTDSEAAHVLQVVKRDMRLRKTEEERLSELKQELDEEDSRCLLLSRQTCFNQRCCIRCCSPFTFLLNPKRRCRDCSYDVCKACRVYCKRDRAWLCSTCQKSRLLKTQSLEWFYANVKKRFKRFGSAKVLKTLYRKHLTEHSALSELTEGSACEESICNEGSVCESDSTFYRQTEEHSMAETLSVATRVAEEVIDEAISTAEFDASTQEKQNEARYLRQHRGELIEDLAKTIVQKIISRRNALAEMKAEYDHSWPLEHAADLHRHHQPPCDRASSCLKPELWRSHLTLRLLDEDSAALGPDSPSALKKEGGGLAMTARRSVDRLDNSVLKSPDGNWIALQSAQLSRPTLLTKRKSLVYSALERESGAVSAYEGLDSDSENKPEPDSSWGAVLQEIHRKMLDSNLNLHDFDNTVTPLMDHQVERDDLFSDSEGNWKSNKPLLALLKRRVPAEIRKPSSSRRTSIIDVSFNTTGDGEEEDVVKVAAEPKTRKMRRSRKKRRSKKEPASVSNFNNKASFPLHPSDAGTPDTVTSGVTTPEPFESDGDITGNGDNLTVEDFSLKLHQFESRVSESHTREKPDERYSTDDGKEEGRSPKMDADLGGGGGDEEEVNYRLYRLVSQFSLPDFSSTDYELDGTGQSEAEWDQEKDLEEEDKEQKTERLTYRLCQLEKEVKASQFSSTEDELDRVDFDEDREEALAVRLSRLAHEVDPTQYSSTEYELDRSGRGDGEEEAMDEETLWKLQPDKTQLCHLASLISASQFSSTEDELDRVGGNEGDGGEMKELWDGAESIGNVDMKMFDLREEAQEQRVLESRTKSADDETNIQRSRNLLDKISGDVATEKEFCDKKVENLKAEKESMKTQEIPLEADKTPERDDEPAANRTDEKEEKFSTIGERKWETVAKSDEEDAEFDRIISSMLMITLEDMHVETMDENGRKKLENDREGESGSRTSPADPESRDTSDERSESAVKEQNETEGQISNKWDAKDMTDRSENTEEGLLHLVKDKLTDLTVKETLSEAEPMSPEDLKLDGRESTTEQEAAETRTDLDQKPDGTGRSHSSDHQGGFLSPEEIQNRYSAASLRSITTEVLKVLNATEDLLQGAEGRDDTRLSISLPPNADPKKLDQQFWKLEENVYVAAGSVYSLEVELSDLEECAREICSSTSNMELSFLEEQVAAAAARVQQSELQISNISARIAALKSAGLNVDPQSRFNKTPKTTTDTAATLDSSRHLRRRLPAPPVKGGVTVTPPVTPPVTRIQGDKEA